MGWGVGRGTGLEPQSPCASLCFVPEPGCSGPFALLSVDFPLSEDLCPAGGRWGGKEKADSKAEARRLGSHLLVPTPPACAC